MKGYDKSHLADQVAIWPSLAGMIRSVEKVPATTEVPEGCVCQLTRPQWGYVVTHYYLLTRDSEGGELYWKDLTSDNRIAQDELQAFAILEIYDDLEQYQVYWETPEDIGADKWLYDVLVGKAGSKPEHINDGYIVTICQEANLHKFTETGVLNPFHTSFTNSNHVTDDSEFRVFHIYQSGYISYSECPTDKSILRPGWGIVVKASICMGANPSISASNDLGNRMNTCFVWSRPRLIKNGIDWEYAGYAIFGDRGALVVASSTCSDTFDVFYNETDLHARRWYSNQTSASFTIVHNFRNPEDHSMTEQITEEFGTESSFDVNEYAFFKYMVQRGFSKPVGNTGIGFFGKAAPYTPHDKSWPHHTFRAAYLNHSNCSVWLQSIGSDGTMDLLAICSDISTTEDVAYYDRIRLENDGGTLEPTPARRITTYTSNGSVGKTVDPYWYVRMEITPD